VLLEAVAVCGAIQDLHRHALHLRGLSVRMASCAPVYPNAYLAVRRVIDLERASIAAAAPRQPLWIHSVIAAAVAPADPRPQCDKEDR
jgi:hypothetical protein